MNHNFKTGDILLEYAGYSTTTLKWYEVIKATKATVTVQAIGARRVEHNNYSCTDWVPTPGVYFGEPMRRRPDGKAVRGNANGHAFPWDGSPKYCDL